MSQSRPNILVIMTDQQRGDCLSVDGHPVLMTPQMDELAGQGVRFRRAYSTCPVCIPARRSFMSGQFPSTHGLLNYRDGLEWNCDATLPAELANAGYQTAIVGRNMHLYPQGKPYGFEYMRLSAGVKTPGAYEQWMEENQPDGGGGYYGSGVMHNDWTARPWHLGEHLHQTNWTVNEGLRFLRERDRSRPYFLIVSFVAPHPPLIPPSFYFDRYLRLDAPPPAIGDWETPPDPNRPVNVSDGVINLTGEARRCMLAGYFGLINHIDDQIRRILSPVSGFQDKNTVTILTADHGEMLGDHYLFRKQQPFEPSARIPMLIRGGRDLGFHANVTRNHPVCLEDIMPTCLDLAGAPIPDSVDGKSLVPLLRGDDAPVRDVLHAEYAPNWHMLTDGRYKYIWWNKDGRELFFDLQSDPTELRDLSAKHDLAPWRARLVNQLRTRPEGFVENDRLIHGKRYSGLMAHAHGKS